MKKIDGVARPLVEITAYADEDAYAIFETVNDRGLRVAHVGRQRHLPAA